MGQVKNKGNGIKTKELEFYINDVKNEEKNRNINRIFLSLFVVFSMFGVYYIISNSGGNTLEKEQTENSEKESNKKGQEGEQAKASRKVGSREN